MVEVAGFAGLRGFVFGPAGRRIVGAIISMCTCLGLRLVTSVISHVDHFQTSRLIW
jgi:hypothetical protein